MQNHPTARPDDFGPHRRQALDDLLGDAEYLHWPPCPAHIWQRVSAGASTLVPGPNAGPRAWQAWAVRATYRHVLAAHGYLRRHFGPQLAERTPAAEPPPPRAPAPKKHGGGAKKREEDPLWMMLATAIAAHEDSMDKRPGLEQLWNWAMQMYAHDPVALARLPENPAEIGRMLRHYRSLPRRGQLQREEP